jgi:hypothetical protein
MRIHSYIKVFVAALTIAFAVSMGTVAVSAQTHPQVSVSNLTQVRLTCNPANLSDMWCGTYDEIAPGRWVLRMKDGKAFQFAEFGFHGIQSQSSGRSLVLTDASRYMFVQFYFGGIGSVAWMNFGGSGTNTPVSGTITGVYEISADNSPETCSQQTTAPGMKCTCDLGTLRPLQGAVGMEEVRKKARDIKNGEKTRLDLAYDPIKIVRGPNGLLYVTDHHHGARAWIQDHTMGTCQIQSDTISTDPTQFWTDLKAKNLVRLADKNGNPITKDQLPDKLRALPDDPYRTLAWRVRKGGGFCRALMTGNTEFAEFQWADWLRTRITPSPREGKNWSDGKREAAIALAKTSAAAGLPGYRGDKPSDYTCPPDPDADPQ